MRIIEIAIPDSYLEPLNRMVQDELFPSFGEAIRYAVRHFLQNQYLGFKLVHQAFETGQISHLTPKTILEFTTRGDEPFIYLYFRNQPEIIDKFLEKCEVPLEGGFFLLL